MSKVIITGVDGHFGSYAAESIQSKVDKSDLIFTSPNVAVLDKYKNIGIDSRQADFNDADNLKNAFAGGDTLLLISLPFVGEKRRDFHKNAIDAAISAGVKKVIYTSTVGAGIPENKAMVVVDHEFTENYIWSTDLVWNILRDSQYTEAMLKVFEEAAGGSGVISNNHGDGSMSLVTRNDCAEAAVCVVAGRGEDNTIYDITGPEQIDMETFVSTGSEVTGQKVIYRYIDDDEMYKHWDSLGIPRSTDGDFSNALIPYCSDDMVSYGRAIRLGQMNKLSNHVELLTGRKPKSLRAVFEDFENHEIGDRTATE